MKKSIVILFAGALLFGFPISYAATLPKDGSSCTKVNSMATSSGMKFQCVKIGKNLKWKSLDSNHSSSKTKYLKLYPVDGAYGITWDNIVSKFNDISAAAWLDAQATIKRNKDSANAASKYSSFISPGALKVDPSIAEAENLLKKDFSLFARYPSYPKVYFVALTTDEREDVKKQLLKKFGSVEFINQSIDAMYGVNSNSPAGSVFSAPKCSGDDSARNSFTSSTAAVIIGVCPSIDGRDVHFAGIHSMAHEYIHMIQSAFMPGQDYGSSAPCWMTEGEAEWSQAAVSESFSDYLKAQTFQPYYLTQDGLDYKESPPREWTAAEVAQYLNEAIDISKCYKTNKYAFSYSLGAATTEALVSIGGSESFFALHNRFIDGMPYNQAFKEVYGITWDKAVPILSQIVAKKVTLSYSPNALTYQTQPLT